MAKKERTTAAPATATATEFKEHERDNTAGGMLDSDAGAPGMPQINTDFDLEDEYKAQPLVPQGNYNAAITSVTFNSEAQCLIWQATIHSSGIFATGGEVAVDGMTVFYRNWLPKPGDESELTKRGDQSKRQAKINMLKDFADKMNISLNSPAQIIQGITEQIWIGHEVIVTVDVREYEGRVMNDVKKMVGA